MIDINELRRLAQAATPGPWSVVEHDHSICVQTESPSKSKYGASRYAAIGGFDRSDPVQLEEARANARLIAAANPTAINELLDRLEAAESDGLEQALLNGMGGEREAALLSKLEAAEKETASWKGLAKQFGNEADALRLLVVMRFDHDHPPQFAQGYYTHELTEPVTAEHCRWFVAEIERLRAKIAEMEQQEPVAFA